MVESMWIMASNGPKKAHDDDSVDLMQMHLLCCVVQFFSLMFRGMFGVLMCYVRVYIGN